MKKIIFAALALLFFGQGQAQKITLGVNAGATYSGFPGMEVPTVNYQYGFGFMAGLSFEYYFTDKLALKANLSYDRKSNRGKSAYELRESYDDPPQTYRQTIRSRYDYLTLPILVKYNFGAAGAGPFFINGGPFAGYLLQSEIRSKSTPASGLDESPLDTTDASNRLDFGLSLGIGKTFRLSGKNDLVVEIRDNLGLANVNKSSGIDFKTNSFNLIMGWSFTL